MTCGENLQKEQEELLDFKIFFKKTFTLKWGRMIKRRGGPTPKLNWKVKPFLLYVL